MLSDIGFVDALMVREVDGGLELLDGHLRADIAADARCRWWLLDLTDEEADKVLATFDPLAGLALVDGAKLDDLLSNITLDENAEMRTHDRPTSRRQAGEGGRRTTRGPSARSWAWR